MPKFEVIQGGGKPKEREIVLEPELKIVHEGESIDAWFREIRDILTNDPKTSEEERLGYLKMLQDIPEEYRKEAQKITSHIKTAGTIKTLLRSYDRIWKKRQASASTKLPKE